MNSQALIELFGSMSELARATKINKGAMSNYLTGRRRMTEPVKLKILKAAQKGGINWHDFERLYEALEPESCPHCGEVLDPEIRRFLLT